MICYNRLQGGLFGRGTSWIAGTGAVLLLGLCLPALSPDEAAAANAGRTTAVVQQARGTPPGQPTRTLQPKVDVFLDERIQTDEVGVTQILFVDGTNLTVGPRSDLVIDRFVYNPDTSTGELVGKFGGGVLRIVGGHISKRGKIEITTPVAVIGVRGGIALVRHDAADGARVIFLFGEELTVTGLGPDAQPTQTKTITRAGFSTAVSPAGTVAAVVPTEAEELRAVLSALEAQENTGTSNVSREAVAKSGSAYSEESENTVLAESELGLGQDAGHIPDAAEEAQQRTDARPSPPALWVYDAVSGNIRYTLPALAFDRSRSHPFTVVKQEGDAASSGGYRPIFVRSRFVGQGASQQAAVFVITGRIGPSGDYPGIRLQTRTSGSVRDPSSAQHNGRAATFISYVNGEEDRNRHPSPIFNGETPPGGFTIVGQERQDGLRRISVLAQNYWVDADGDGNDDDGVFVSSAHFLNPVVEYGLGEVRPVTGYGPRGDGIWKGYATGLFQGWNTNNEDFVYVMENRNGSPDDVSIHRKTQYSILGASFALGLEGTGSDGVTSMRLDFGRFAGQQDEIRRIHPRGDILIVTTSRGTYLSDDVFAAQTSLAWWGDASRVQRLIWVNDGLIREAGPGRSPTRTWLFSNTAAPADGLLPDGVQFCDCPAVKFGWWGGRISFDDPNTAGVERRDDVFPGAFVVGLLPEIADIPTAGTASYSGHVGATVNDGGATGATYAAVGGFTMNWNFGTRTGAASIMNLAGRDYAASGLTAPANPRDFTGALTQTGGPGSASGSMGGSFFSNGSNPVVDAGGQFTVSGGGYTATGSFAATSQ